MSSIYNLKKWTIWKGWHYSLSHFIKRFSFWMDVLPGSIGNPKSVSFIFNESCYYNYNDKDDLDVNKLFGFSIGAHHKNSIRVGWTPNFKTKNCFTLYFYTYNKGQRKIEEFSTVQAGQKFTINIDCIKDLNFVSFELRGENGNSITRKAISFKFPDKKWGYYLWFYFGGNKKAPRRISIEMGN